MREETQNQYINIYIERNIALRARCGVEKKPGRGTGIQIGTHTKRANYARKI